MGQLKYDLNSQWFGGEAYAEHAKFNYLRHFNRIPLDKFQYKVKSISPKHRDFLPYWKEEVRRVFEGHWVEHDAYNVGEDGQLEAVHIAKWLPGWTHFHVNHWSIEFTNETKFGKQKVWKRPGLRDLEFIRGYVFATAKGFSGFEGDEQYTCYRAARSLETLSDVLPYLSDERIAALRRPDGSWKEYREALPYLYEEKAKPMGKALFMNSSQNVGDLEARGSGKTYNASGFAGWAWVTDGMTDYDEHLRLRRAGETPTTQQMFLSYDVAYQKTLLRAFFKGLEEMPGGGSFEGYKKPLRSPLYKRWTGGTLTDVGAIEQRFERKASGTKASGKKAKKKKGGSGTMLHVRSLYNDATAGNGPRCSYIFIEEWGFVENSTAAMGQLRATASDDNEQYGVIWLSGTGGDTKGTSTQQVRQMMENPGDYGCMAFWNVMENLEQRIGMFVPGHLMLNKYKDAFGNTDFAAAEKYVEEEYRKAELLKDAKVLLRLKTRLPRTMNDALLSLTGSSFPVAALTDVLTAVTTNTTSENKAVPGYYRMRGQNKQDPEFVLDYTRVPLEEYPIKFDVDMRGAWMILEAPDHSLPPGTYAAGIDPYNQDEVKDSSSVGACYIGRRAHGSKYPTDRIVAWYVGRPATYTEYYEQTRLACRDYHAEVLAENETTLLRDHYILHGSVDLLAPPPPLLRANIANGSVRALGQGMTAPVKKDLMQLSNRWLVEPVQTVRTEGKAADVEKLRHMLEGSDFAVAEHLLPSVVETVLMNMNFICDPGLLRELIAHDDKGNFDRVIAFLLLVAQMYQQRGNLEMAQTHSQLAATLRVLEERKNSTKRGAKRHIAGLPEFIRG